MTRSDRGRSLVSDLPIDRILTETDGPFTQVVVVPASPLTWKPPSPRSTTSGGSRSIPSRQR